MGSIRSPSRPTAWGSALPGTCRSPTTSQEDGFFGMALLDSLEESRLPALIAATRAAGTWMVPTMGFFESMAGDETIEALSDRPELRYVSRSMALNWINGTRQLRGGGDDTAAPRPARPPFLAP